MIEKHFKVSFKADMKITEGIDRIKCGMLALDLDEVINESANDYSLPSGKWGVEEIDGIDHREAIARWFEKMSEDADHMKYGLKAFAESIRNGDYLK